MSDPMADAVLAMNRRGFLRFATACAALGYAGCLGSGAPGSLAPPADLELQVLSPQAYATFQAAAMRLVGARGEQAIRARRVDPAAAADAWAARLPGMGETLAQGLWILEFGVHPLVAKWRPFTALDPRGQDDVLENLMLSRWDSKRDLFKGLKSVAMLAYYADPASRAAIGHPGPLDRQGIALAMQYALEPDPEAEAAAALRRR